MASENIKIDYKKVESDINSIKSSANDKIEVSGNNINQSASSILYDADGSFAGVTRIQLENDKTLCSSMSGMINELATAVSNVLQTFKQSDASMSKKMNKGKGKKK